MLYRLAFAMGAATLASNAANAQPATFTCTAPMTCPEVVVCQTPALAGLDRTVAALYRNRVLGTTVLGTAGVTTLGTPVIVAPSAITVGQRDFLLARNSCGCNASCLFGVYRSRAIALGGAVYASVLGGAVVE
jgi:uncharacterized protein